MAGVRINMSGLKRRRQARALTAALCATVTGLSVVSATAPAVAATQSKVTLTATPATVLRHGTFSLTGAATPRGAGVINLQQYVSGHWKQLSHKTASATGAYSFAMRAGATPGTTIYRVTRPGSGTLKTLLSPTFHVHTATTAFKVSATAPSLVAAGASTKVTGSVASKTSGIVVLEQLTGKVWKQVSTSKLSSASTFAVSHTFAVGHYQLRVRKPATNTVAAGYS